MMKMGTIPNTKTFKNIWFCTYLLIYKKKNKSVITKPEAFAKTDKYVYKQPAVGSRQVAISRRWGQAVPLPGQI